MFDCSFFYVFLIVADEFMLVFQLSLGKGDFRVDYAEGALSYDLPWKVKDGSLGLLFGPFLGVVLLLPDKGCPEGSKRLHHAIYFYYLVYSNYIIEVYRL